MTDRRLQLASLALLGPILVLFAASLVLAGLTEAIAPRTAHADDADKKGEETKGDEGKGEEDAKGGDENPLQTCDDKKAKALATEVNKIRKKKDAKVVIPVLEKIEDFQHKDFEKPLLKLLQHPSSLVSVRAAEMWEWRNHKKVAKKVWAATWGDRRVNKRRHHIKALVLKSWPRAGLTLSDKEFKEVKSTWRWIVGNPDEILAPALTAIAEYVELAKDKRLCRKLAEELDEPGTNVNVNDANNPPQSWWEKRWKLWKAAKPAVVSALKELTGQEFDKTAVAKKWFEANEKTFGFKW